MTLYVSDTDFQVVSGSVTARFEAGVPRPLRPSLVNPAIGMGVREAEGGDVESGVEQPDAEQETEALDLATVAEAMRAIMARGEPGDMTAAGEIRMNVLEAEVGYDVSTEDREAAKELIEE